MDRIHYTLHVAAVVIAATIPAQLVKARSPEQTGAFPMGYWKNKNGQALIDAASATDGVCNPGVWLREYTPFQDLSATATCPQVASYVSNVIGGATAAGASMNGILKAQMLATSLDVYFSDPALGGNRIGAPAPIGGAGIDVSKICSVIGGSPATCSGPYLDTRQAFGLIAPVTSQTVSYLLVYAAGQSNVGSGVWYANSKSTQELAKDAFDAINNQVAFAGQPPIGTAGPKIGLPVYSPPALIVGVPATLTVSSFIASGNGGPGLLPGGVSLLELDVNGNVIATLGVLNDNGVGGDAQTGDGIFTGQFTFNVTSPGTIRLQVSATFGGLSNTMRSSIMPLEVLPPEVPIGPARPSSNPPVTDASGNKMACDRVVALFAPGTSIASISSLISAIGGQIIGFSPRINAHAWEIGIPCNGSQGVVNAVAALLSNAITIGAEPDFALHSDGVIPNDPMFNQFQVVLHTMQADTAWAITTGLNMNVLHSQTPPPLIAVVDSGLDYTHEDLMSKVWSASESFTVMANGQSFTCPPGSHGFNFMNDTCDPLDDDGHGSFVAGIAAADSNNGVGITGVSWASPILAEKASDSSGSFVDTFATGDAVAEAVRRGAKIINCSFGGTAVSSLESAITTATQAGVLVIAAAGNDATSQPEYPAGYSTVLSVGGIDPATGNLYDFSNYGPWVDIYTFAFAYSTIAHLCSKEPFCPSGSAGEYFGGFGTSFAAPYVAGAAALVWAANPNLSNTDVRNILLTTADSGPTDPSGTTVKVLNVFKAVLRAAALTCTLCPQAPEVTVNGDQISLGVPNRSSTDSQSISVHGISVPVSPIGTSYSKTVIPDAYLVTFTYAFNTWDSYTCCGPRATSKNGFYDSLSFSSSIYPYWQNQLQDPLVRTTPPFCPSSAFFSNLPCTFFLSNVIGGTTQGILQSFGSNTPVATELTGAGPGPAAGFFAGASSLPFLNFVLDTATQPDADNLLPSWATIQIIDISPICSTSGVPQNPTGTCAR